VEGLGDDAGDVGRIGHQVVVLGDRDGDAGDVGFLERVGADGLGGDLPGDRDHRDGVHVRVGDRGDEVRRPGTGGRHADADLAGGDRVPLGRVAGALLVADQDVPDVRGVHQRVVGGQDRAPGQTEDDLDPYRLERTDEALRAGELGDGELRVQWQLLWHLWCPPRAVPFTVVVQSRTPGRSVRRTQKDPSAREGV
jgi:hypothetical protein